MNPQKPAKKPSLHIPKRQCIVTKERHPKEHLIRLIQSKQGQITLDLNKKSHTGRGNYVKKNLNTIKKMFKKSILQKTFKRKIPSEELEQLKKTFLERLTPQDTTKITPNNHAT